MAGIPELAGLFGTFSGTQGLDLTPVQMRERRRIFQQQLAQQAQQAQAQQALQSRSLDLTERGQDIGREESELARAFQQNLMKMRQDFDASQQKSQQEHAVAAQQRQIQEAQRAQASSQDFGGAQAELERLFRGEQAGLDRVLKREALDFDRERFERQFGFEAEKFNFTKEITLKDQARQDRADELKQEMFELQKAEFASQAEQRAASVKMVEMQTELYAQQLADAREESDLSASEMNQIVQAAGEGDIELLDGALLKKVMTNRKSREAVMGLIGLVQTAQEIGLVDKATRDKEAAATKEVETGGLTKQESDLRESFQRKVDSQSFFTDTDIGQSSPAEVGVVALNALEGLAGQESEEATALRSDLREVVKLVRKIKNGAIGGLFDDTTDRSGRLAVEGLSDEELDRLDELILSLKKNGIELVD